MTVACLPGWYRTLLVERGRAWRAGVLGKELGRDPGCLVGEASRIVDCDPEAMRARTERHIKQLGLRPASWHLPLDVYSIARNIRSEAGIGKQHLSIKVVYAESALIRAKTDKGSISKLTMKNSSRYGRQSGSNPSVATSKDPTWDDIVIAELALAGQLGNFARGTTHYFSPRIMDRWVAQGKGTDSALVLFERWSHGWGSDRDRLVWVGDLPGIDHGEHFLMRKVSKNDPVWTDGVAYAAGRAALSTHSSSIALACDSPLTKLANPRVLAAGALGLALVGFIAVGIYRRQATP